MRLDFQAGAPEVYWSLPDIVLPTIWMELLLNVAWLLLVLPAYWIWQYKAAHGERGVVFARFGSLLILGCVLVLLFPVISATDDLRAMRFEMEEPGSQSSVKQGTNERSSGSVSRCSGFLLPALPSAWGHRNDNVCGLVCPGSVPSLADTQIHLPAFRAPPFPL